MKTYEIANKIKELRKRKGLSQEQLAEEAKLNLRTIQRIENGESEPRGDTLLRLSKALGVNTDDIMEWTLDENRGYLALLNLSSLCFIIFPLIGIIVPLVLWIAQRDKIRYVNETGKKIINFQISFSIFFFIVFGLLIGNMFFRMNILSLFSSTMTGNLLIVYGTFFVMGLYNVILILVNTIRSQRNKPAKYFPAIKFIR